MGKRKKVAKAVADLTVVVTSVVGIVDLVEDRREMRDMSSALDVRAGEDPRIITRERGR